MKSRMDEQIRDLMQQVVDEAPEPPATLIRSSTHPAPPRRMVGWVVAVVASIAVLVLVGGVSWLLGSSSSIVVDDPAPPPTTAPADEAPVGDENAPIFAWDEAESLDEWLTEEEMAGLLGELAAEFGVGDPEADLVYSPPSAGRDAWDWLLGPNIDGVTVMVQRPSGGCPVVFLEHEGLPEGVTATASVWGSRCYRGPNSDDVISIGVGGPPWERAGEKSDRPLQPWEARVASFILRELGWLGT